MLGFGSQPSCSPHLPSSPPPLRSGARPPAASVGFGSQPSCSPHLPSSPPPLRSGARPPAASAGSARNQVARLTYQRAAAAQRRSPACRSVGFGCNRCLTYRARRRRCAAALAHLPLPSGSARNQVARLTYRARRRRCAAALAHLPLPSGSARNQVLASPTELAAAAAQRRSPTCRFRRSAATSARLTYRARRRRCAAALAHLPLPSGSARRQVARLTYRARRRRCAAALAHLPLPSGSARNQAARLTYRARRRRCAAALAHLPLPSGSARRQAARLTYRARRRRCAAALAHLPLPSGSARRQAARLTYRARRRRCAAALAHLPASVGFRLAGKLLASPTEARRRRSPLIGGFRSTRGFPYPQGCRKPPALHSSCSVGSGVIGNTADSGSVIRGSSPLSPAKSLLDGLFRPGVTVEAFQHHAVAQAPIADRELVVVQLGEDGAHDAGSGENDVRPACLDPWQLAPLIRICGCGKARSAARARRRRGPFRGRRRGRRRASPCLTAARLVAVPPIATMASGRGLSSRRWRSDATAARTVSKVASETAAASPNRSAMRTAPTSMLNRSSTWSSTPKVNCVLPPPESNTTSRPRAEGSADVAAR